MASVLFVGGGAARAQSTLDKLHVITPLGPGFARTSSSPNIHLNNRGYVAWPDRDRFGESYLWVPDSPNGTTGGRRFLQMIVTDLNDHGQLVATRLGFESGVMLFRINDSGQIVGGPSTIDSSTDALNSRVAINNRGQVAGLFDVLGGGTSQVRLWTPTTDNGNTGVWYDLPMVSGLDGGPSWINDFGQVLSLDGISAGAQLFTPNGLDPEDGRVTKIGPGPGMGGMLSPRALGASGHVVGNLPGDAAVWEPAEPNSADGSFSRIEKSNPSAMHTEAHFVNGLGEVFGAMGPSSTSLTVVAWPPEGEPITVETLLSAEDQRRWNIGGIVDVNDSGQMVGWGNFNPNGAAGEPGTRVEFFLMTPVPEPGGIMALFMGMLLLRLRRARASDGTKPRGSLAGATSRSERRGWRWR